MGREERVYSGSQGLMGTPMKAKLAGLMIGEGKLAGLAVGAGLLAGGAIQPALTRARTVERPRVDLPESAVGL